MAARISGRVAREIAERMVAEAEITGQYQGSIAHWLPFGIDYTRRGNALIVSHLVRLAADMPLSISIHDDLVSLWLQPGGPTIRAQLSSPVRPLRTEVVLA